MLFSSVRIAVPPSELVLHPSAGVCLDGGSHLVFRHQSLALFGENLFGVLLLVAAVIVCRGTVCLPVAVMVILGIVYGSNSENLAVSFPAVSTIAICAGGVMGLPLVISGYRQNKILKRFKVTPVSPALLLFVQVMIYTIYDVHYAACASEKAIKKRVPFRTL